MTLGGVKPPSKIASEEAPRSFVPPTAPVNDGGPGECVSRMVSTGSKGEQLEPSTSQDLALLQAELQAAKIERNELASSVKLLENRLRALEACLELALHPTKSSAKKQRRGSLKRQHSVARSSSTPHVRVDANAKPIATASTVVTGLPLVNRFSPLSSDLDIPTPEKSSLHISASNAEEESPEAPLPLPPSTTHVKANSNGSQPLWKNPKVKHIWKTTKNTTADEVTVHIAGLGFDMSLSRLNAGSPSEASKRSGSLLF